MTSKLTDLEVKNSRPRTGKYTLAAGRGLTLVVMPDGAKYWRLRYRLGGKARMIGVGKPYPYTSLKQAQSKAAEMRALGPIAYMQRGVHKLWDRIAAFQKPLIAAVNGFALGGGCELALACHIRVASKAAKFGLPETKLGLIPGYGGTQRLPRLIGQGRALQLIFTGEMIDADAAFAMGLANQVVDGTALDDAARSIALAATKNGPLALAHAITAVTQGASLSMDQALALEAEHFGAVGRTADMREGTTAFLEKRAANFRGA